MDRPTMEATKREELGTRAARKLRHQGLVPAVLYGHQLEAVHLAVAQRALENLLHDGARVVDLEIGDTAEIALLKDVQYDAMGDHILHLDLARIDPDEKVAVTIPVELHGLSKGVEAHGVLDHVMQDLEVECSALDIPERIRLEIADLDIADSIHIRDIPPIPGVAFLQDPDAVVLTIHPPVAAPEVEEVPVEEAEAETAAEPEMIGGPREKEEEAESED